MTFPNIFTKEVTDQLIQRINLLKPVTKGGWGKMTVEQMLAHCNVMYEMLFTDQHKKPNWFMGFILKTFIKKIVTGSAPYKPNSKTAPAFIIKGERDFEIEKKRLIKYIKEVEQIGEMVFENKISLMFGSLSKDEWNTMFYKHLNHHLAQFGV